MRTMQLVVLLSFLLLADREAAAQATAGVPIPSGTASQDGTPIFVAAPTDAIVLTPSGSTQPGLLSIEPFDGARPVLGAPYRAEAVTTVTQVLADGNRLENERSVMVARDGRGRTRREHQAIFLGAVVAERQAPLVTIADPATGTHLTLDQERRVALRARTPQFTEISAGTLSGAITLSYPAARAGVRVDWPVVETQLGEKQLEGVRATGTLTTLTIPAGHIGNQFPLDIVSERWYSPDLRVLVMSRRSDPRVGETVYRLTNISLGEPPPSLFEVPPGFRIEEVGGAPR